MLSRITMVPQRTHQEGRMTAQIGRREAPRVWDPKGCGYHKSHHGQCSPPALISRAGVFITKNGEYPCTTPEITTLVRNLDLYALRPQLHMSSLEQREKYLLHFKCLVENRIRLPAYHETSSE